MNPNTIDLICLSHLRWGFVFQRPQHLMSRFAATRRTFFFEEPVFEDSAQTYLRCSICPQTGVHVCTPVMPNGLPAAEIVREQERLLRDMLLQNRIERYVHWYYTPMAREFASSQNPVAIVYDCMDELSAFMGAPSALRTNELDLFRKTDLVFTGGASLFESKQKQHSSVHLFPSSVDFAHFARARVIDEEPEDQSGIPYPRLGYAGVIDERMDIELLRRAASERPNWQFVLLGPIAKIDPASLPRANNIHYLGIKAYADLPAYLSGWQVGLLPFALNESTRFISPTKTPEYLAAGMHVISTPIRDVIHPYADLQLVKIAGNIDEFLNVADSLLKSPPDAARLKKVDNFLAQNSWDKTWKQMNTLLNNAIVKKQFAHAIHPLKKEELPPLVGRVAPV